MFYSHKKLWEKFCEFLRGLEKENLSTIEFMHHLMNWLLSNRKAFPDRSWNDYGFDQLTSLNLEKYEVGFSEDKVDNVQSTISRMIEMSSPTSKDIIAIFIYEILWDCIAHKTEIRCPNCGDDDLRALVDRQSGDIVLACDLCTWAHYKNGNKYTGEPRLEIDTKSDLEKL